MTVRTALVTGATGELGRAVAVELLSRGCRVLLGGRDRAATEALSAALELEFRGRADPIALDVTDAESIEAAMRRIGTVDILVNNAGVLLSAGRPARAVDLEIVHRELAVNAVGAWRVTQAVLPGMLARGWGRVVNVSSGAASFGYGLFGGAPGYAMSKAALNAITLLLAEDLRGSGVLVNAVNPGQLKSRMRPAGQRLPAEAARDIADRALLAGDGPSGTFTRAGGGAMPW